MDQQAFKISPEMEAEVENEISKAVASLTHDTPREMFGTPRVRRRASKGMEDSGGTEQGPANDLGTGQGINEPDQTDPVNHPKHYTSHPSGVECITVVEWMSFNLGNAVKYIWRAGMKGYQTEDLMKAKWYIEREIRRLGNE